MIGANDLARFVPPAQAAASLAAAVTALRATGTDVVVVPAPDMSSVPFVPPAFRPVVRAACAQLQQHQAAAVEAAGGRMAAVPPRSAGRSPATRRMFSADRFHPSSAGYAAIAAALAPHVVGSPSAAGTAPQPDGCQGSRACEQSRQGAGLAGRRQLVELGPAGEAVGQHDGVRPEVLDGGQQLLLGDRPPRRRGGRVSTPQLPASPQQPPSRVTRAPALGQQRRVGRPAEHRGVVAVRLRDDLDAAQARRRATPAWR